MILALLLIVVGLLSLLLMSYYSKGREAASWGLLLNLFAPMAIGVSCVVFITLNLIGMPLMAILLLEVFVIAILLYKLKKNDHVWIGGINPLSMSKLLSMPILLIVVIVYAYSWLVDAGVFLFDSVRAPHGLWDAWNYWNLKAKIISKAPDVWPQLFHQMISEDFHVDYPLLQTGFIAQCWLSLKSDTVWVPILLSFVFTFSTIGLLSSSVGMLTHRIKGLMAGLIMLCTPFYMVMGDSQYADNVVGFFFLATIVLLTIARKQASGNPALFIMTGVAAGLSAWSKNEGLLFLLCLFVVQFSMLLFKDFKSLFWELKYIALGVLPTLILILYFKYAIAPPNDIIKAQGKSTLDKLFDPARYSMVIEWFSKVINSFGNWYIAPWWFFLAGLVLYRIDWTRFRYLLPNVLLVLFMTAGFFFIYIITPLDLEFHLSTSLHRLFFQLFPTFIFTYFILINDNVYKKK